MSAGDKKDALRRKRTESWKRQGAVARALGAEQANGVTFCEEEEQRRERTLTFEKKSEQVHQ